MTQAFGTDLAALVAQPGANHVTWHDQAFPDRPLRLHAARPVRFTPDTHLLFVLHGVRRNGEDYRDFWLPFVDEAELLAISIEFPETSFPDYLWYNFGNLHAADGTPNPREAWTFAIPDRLFGALHQQGITRRRRYGLFGHSAGGQFVHRMLSFGWRDRVAVAVGANAGTYAMPDLETAWPFGLGETAMDDPSLREWLAFPLTVMAGTEDTRTTGRHFPNGPRSNRQGPTRYARAHRYVELGHAAATRIGTSCAWRVIDVPGVGHDGRRMSAAAAPVVAAALRADRDA
ncbi:MAG: hypothetical protein BGO51_05115 [Rhodospirillales bacterium 69-11]|nr:MAG: hypothetical protein BGO51_05115 [Rhodospirillales bacterium 69-11]